jgi:hypothetical protein
MILGIATRAGSLVAVEAWREATLLDRRQWLYPFVPALMIPGHHSSIWMLGDGPPEVRAQSLLRTTCEDDGVDAGLIVCGAFDGTHTRLVTVDPGNGRVTAAGNVDGSFVLQDAQADGWVAGWATDGAPAVLRLSTGERHHLPDDSGGVYALAVTSGVAAAAEWREAGSRIRVYALTEGGWHLSGKSASHLSER